MDNQRLTSMEDVHVELAMETDGISNQKGRKTKIIVCLALAVILIIAIAIFKPIKLIATKLVCTIFGLVIAMCAGFAIYDISTQGKCIEVTNRNPTYDCRWPAGLDMVDYLIEKGRIIAYKIQWWNGVWTGWYVPGINDLDGKFNPTAKTCSIPYKANSMRHMWSYFYDHNHTFIICRPN